MASTHAIIVGWNRAVPGKEKIAAETFGGFTGYLQGLVHEKKIESFEPVLMTPHGGDLNGFFLIRGDRNKLNEVTATDNWQTWAAKGGYLMQNFGVIHSYIGDEVQTQMNRWMKVVSGS